MMRRSFTICALIAASILLGGCNEIQRPKVEPFYAASAPPLKQELRWSNGKLPKTLDPAQAKAAPETDIVRAVYEGLTELDGETLDAVPAVAERWESTDDGRTWTFFLRKDARWSNGERVTAEDFVRSWQRLRDTGANKHLYQNIVGMKADATPAENGEEEPPTDFLQPPPIEQEPQDPAPNADPDTARPVSTPQPAPKPAQEFGVEAVDDTTLKIRLELPDKDLPRLVANPVFRPVHKDTEAEDKGLDASGVTNGAFRIAKIDENGVMLERSDAYWDKRSVALERVEIKAVRTAEAALDAYRRGEIDVVTNAAFEPAALKVLTPYQDFRRTTHNALNYYEFNTSKKPFDDRRVREALSLAIDREKLVQSELEGATQPAFTFFPLSELEEPVSFDVAKAKELLVAAGYNDGVPFPEIRLVVNRNDTQQRVARVVARMWKLNLGIDTEITVKETGEMDAVRAAGDYDLIRRGLVMPVNDELVNLTAMLGPDEISLENPAVIDQAEGGRPERSGPPAREDETGAAAEGSIPPPAIVTEAGAIADVKVMPLYFPLSYSLVKPYVLGFDVNSLDAPSLKTVSIDSEWRPKR